LLKHLGMLARRKWVVLPALLLVPLVAVVLSLREKPLYQASAEVLLSHQSLASSLSGLTDPTASLQPDRVAQTQADLARVPEVARRALKAAGVRDRSIHDLLNASSVSTKSNADLLEFDVRDHNPRLAARLATAYARQFIVFRTALDSAALDAARKGIEQRLSQLRAAGATGSALYADLTAKSQQLVAIESLQTTSALLVRSAGSATKVAPRPLRSALLGVIFGLVLGVALAFLLEALDTRIRTAGEIERRLGLPLLARLPTPSPQMLARRARGILREAGSPYAESIRVLRVRLGLARPDSEVRSLMVTSATAREGKSTTVANLAIALAEAGRKVVLCDLDARRPAVDRFFRLQGRPGLVEVALGMADLERAITVFPIPRKPYRPRQRSSNGNDHESLGGVLEVLTLGQAPPDPAEFVGSQGVSDVLARLRERADIVLIDAPSLLGVGDTMTLSDEVDALLIVTRLNILRRRTLDELSRVLASSPAPALGFVLTGAELEDGYAEEHATYASSFAQPAPIDEDEPVKR
jgi:Mrp family chromosome partitioning ATPase/capsular polysaccharide biosynthesis protein